MRYGNVLTWFLFASVAAADDGVLHGIGTSLVDTDNVVECEGSNSSSHDTALATHKLETVTEDGEIHWEGLASRKLEDSGGGSIHSGDRFQDAFYHGECYKVDKYYLEVCVQWVNSNLLMVSKDEYDIDRYGARVLKWTNGEVAKLLNWNIGMMTWDNNNGLKPTRLLDASNIRVLDQAGYYYIRRVTSTANSYYAFNQPFANFALGEGGFHNPPFGLCPNGNSPHIKALSTVPMCCKSDASTLWWYCSHPLESGMNYYTTNCVFDINDCSDPLQDCISKKQYCLNMVLATDDDQCESNINECYLVHKGKWMFPGAEFTTDFSSAPALPTTPYITLAQNVVYRKIFTHDSGFFEAGNYKCIWRLRNNQFSTTNLDPETDVVMIRIKKSGDANQSYFYHDVLWKEWTEEIMHFEHNFVVSTNESQLRFLIKNKVSAFTMQFDLVSLVKTQNVPTQAPTQSLWQQIDGWCLNLTVDNLGNIHCVGGGNQLYYRGGVGGQWSVIAYNFNEIAGSSDGFLFGIKTDSTVYYKTPGNAFVQLTNTGTIFDEISISEGGSHLYAVNSNKRDVYYRNGFSGTWQTMSGDLHYVTVSGDGNHVWGYQKNRPKNNVLYKGNGGSWVRISGPCKFLSLAVTTQGNHVWGVCAEDGDLYHREGSGGEWELVHVPCTATQVIVSGNGQHVWVLDPTGYPFYRAESEFVE